MHIYIYATRIYLMNCTCSIHQTPGSATKTNRDKSFPNCTKPAENATFPRPVQEPRSKIEGATKDSPGQISFKQTQYRRRNKSPESPEFEKCNTIQGARGQAASALRNVFLSMGFLSNIEPITYFFRIYVLQKPCIRDIV